MYMFFQSYNAIACIVFLNIFYCMLGNCVEYMLVISIVFFSIS